MALHSYICLAQVTPDQLLYPNPLSELSCGDDHLRHFEFLGRVLGKALYESILVRIRVRVSVGVSPHRLGSV